LQTPSYASILESSAHQHPKPETFNGFLDGFAVISVPMIIDGSMAGALILSREGRDQSWVPAEKMCLEIIGTFFAKRLCEDEIEHAKQKADAAKFRFDALFQSVREGRFELSADGWIVRANQAFADLMGYCDPQALITGTGGMLRNICADPVRFDTILLSFAEDSSTHWNECIDFLRPDGVISTICTTLRPVPFGGRDQRQLVIEGGAQELREDMDFSRSPVPGGSRDPLTGMPTLAAFQDRLGALLKRIQSAELEDLVVVQIGLDELSLVSGTLGQGAQDTVVSVAGLRIASILPPHTFLARTKTDEFCFVLEGAAAEPWLQTLAARIRASLNEAIEWQDATVYLTASIGIALAGDSALTFGELIHNADTAMHTARVAGAPQTQFFDEKMRDKRRRELALRGDLRTALSDGQFRVVYQPIIRTADRRPVGFEALCRWEHPLYGPIPPSQFIAAAEESDFIGDLGEWVLRQTCIQIVELSEELGVLTPYVTVNVAPSQILAPGFLERLRDTLISTGADARLLKIELTESVLSENLEVITEVLHRIRALGCQVLIDDFGTGYSSLSRLYRLPIDGLKIDRAFVQPLQTDPGSAKIIRAIVGLAQSLEIDTVAEGIETESDLDILSDLGCDFIQGYFFSKPVERPETLSRMQRLEVQAAAVGN